MRQQTDNQTLETCIPELLLPPHKGGNFIFDYYSLALPDEKMEMPPIDSNFIGVVTVRGEPLNETHQCLTDMMNLSAVILPAYDHDKKNIAALAEGLSPQEISPDIALEGLKHLFLSHGDRERQKATIETLRTRAFVEAMDKQDAIVYAEGGRRREVIRHDLIGALLFYRNDTGIALSQRFLQSFKCAAGNDLRMNRGPGFGRLHPEVKEYFRFLSSDVGLNPDTRPKEFNRICLHIAKTVLLEAFSNVRKQGTIVASEEPALQVSMPLAA